MIELGKIVNSVFNSITYLLIDKANRNLALVDCGDVEPIIEFAVSNNLNLTQIFITHTHFDHIYGLNGVLQHFSEAVIYTSANGKLGLYDTRLNLSLYNTDNNPFIFQHKNVSVLQEGDVIQFSNNFIHILSTPGHDWSCLSYQTGNMVFTGDSYIPGIKVSDRWPKSNREEAEKSLTRLIGLEKSGSIICPGHFVRRV